MTKRDEYIENLKKQLDAWNTEASKWEAKAKAAQTSMRGEYEKQLELYRKQRDQALEQMRKMQASSGEAWKDFVRGTDDAWTRMREAVERARSHFQK
jgi:hypothetical protein